MTPQIPPLKPIKPMKPVDPTTKPVKPNFSKKYQVYCGEKLVKSTDDLLLAGKKIEDLKLNNEISIRFRDNKTGDQIYYTKEKHQKNYRLIKVAGNVK